MNFEDEIAPSADKELMGLATAAKWGAGGLMADLCVPYLTQRLGGVGGFLAGLFQPEAGDLNRAYNPSRSGGRAPSGNSDWNLRGLGTMALISFGAMEILPRIPFLGHMFLFSNPNYLNSIPTHPASLLPFAWNRGLIRNWGLLAGSYY